MTTHGRVFHESDVNRDGQGQFAEKAGGAVKKATGNASFLAKLSKKIGATDDKATAKAKLTWTPDAPKKTGAFNGVKVAKKAAPATAPAVAPVKVAGPDTLPKKAAVKKAAAASGTYRTLTRAQAAAMQRKMTKGQPLTPAERGALRTYTGEKYTTINGALRKGGGTPKTKATIANARKGMRPTPENITAYRGMGAGSAFGFIRNKKITDAQLDALVGKTWSDPGFTSTAIRDGGYGSGQRLRARIAVPAGTRGAFVEGFTQNKGEDELVLDAGTHFKVTGYERHPGGKVTLIMEVDKQDD